MDTLNIVVYQLPTNQVIFMGLIAIIGLLYNCKRQLKKNGCFLKI